MSFKSMLALLARCTNFCYDFFAFH